MEKIKLVQARLRRRKLDAVLIGQPDNRLYLSGFNAPDYTINESSGFLLIPRAGQPFLLTDSRYTLQARQEAAGFEIRTYKGGLLPLLNKLLPRLAVKRLAFEPHYILYSQVLRLTKLCRKHHIELQGCENFIERLRVVKSQREIELIRQSVLLNEAVFQEILPTLRPHDTEIETAMRLENAMRAHGAERPSFETIVAAGPNGAKPHATPGQQQLGEGLPIIIDMGLILNNYCSDMTRSVILGTPETRTVEIFRLVRKAQLSGIKALRAGVSGREVDKAARSVISQAGFGDNFGHSLGHGVGIAVHEEPRLSPGSRKKLAAGMVVTVEPGIYIEGWGGVRLENMALVTDSGCEIFNQDRTFLDI
ncbi:Aminopeptidase YpdF (MP-, MA-, MS-, AP-, NP-specific) [hydrothermal vent metagenome]|uniref:Aminopeptidase YpdF (MP-, MA-, MS-, AP-, NP-specific) n=1 Tax=hydrothermal vent metagenome TaxID=652676 RepID=A0A3B0UYS4_9ZZZZ